MSIAEQQSLLADDVEDRPMVDVELFRVSQDVEPKRRCSRCGEYKPLLTAFRYSALGRLKRHTICNDCGRTMAKERNRRKLREAQNALIQVVDAECGRCGVRKPVSEFSKGTRNDGLSSYCKPCRKEHHLVKSFGITIGEYDEMSKRQGNVCAICGGANGNPRHQGRLCVDHDHETGKVRGLLCDDCNLAIGKMGDDPDRLIRAAAYIRRHGRVGV